MNDTFTEHLEESLPPVEEIDRQLALKSLHHFIPQHWRYVDTAPFIDNWHIGIISEHLEAVYDGQITRLIINIPPRHMKSLAVSVFFPAWCWLHEPGLRFLFASYAQSLSIRDSVKCRRVIQSPQYIDLMTSIDPDFKLTSDQNTKIRFENNKGGYRIATSVEGALTGEGGDIICIDDPHNVIEGESEAVRRSTISWWDEAMSTRLNDAKTGAYIIIMQRVHEEDLTGHILAKNNHYDHVCLPARYEGKNRIISTLGAEDPRTEEGQLLWEERLGETEVSELEEALGEYASAGQLQQRPAPREGGLFKPENAEIVSVLPDKVVSSCRFWDKAGTKDGGAFTAGVKLSKLQSGKFIIEDVKRGQWEALEREKNIKQTGQIDGTSVEVGIEQEGGSGGKESAQATVRNMAGYVIKTDHPTGSKEARAEPFAVQFNAGNVYILKGDWNKAYMDELRNFPVGKYKDQTDASSGAFNQMTKTKEIMVA